MDNKGFPIALALILAALAAGPVLAQSPLARAAGVEIPGAELIVGAADQAADRRLDCSASAVQHTIMRCALGQALVSQASCLGRRIKNTGLNVHFQGEILNMSVEFAPGNSADGVIGQLASAFGREPTVQYWADDSHLFASYIWVDKEAEVEVTKTVKGDAGGGGEVRMYVSTLLGGLPMSPEDSPQ